MSGLTLADLRGLAPELALAAAAAVVLTLDLALRGSAPRRSSWIALAGALVAGAFAATPGGGEAKLALLASDGFAAVFQSLLIAGALAALAAGLAGLGGPSVSARGAFLVLAGTAGGCRMVATSHGLAMLVGAAIMSLSASGLAAECGSRARAGATCAKQVVASGLALACSLFGASLLFALGGTLDLSELSQAAAAGALAAQLASDPLPVALALALFCAAFAQLAALAPLHAATVDVLEDAPAPAAVWLSVVARTAGLGALLRILGTLFLRDGAPPAWSGFAPRAGLVLAVLAAATMTLGNLCALRQGGLRRLLAWSSAAQTGAVALGLACASETGAAAAVLGALWLALTNAAFWIAAGALERGASSDRLSDLRGALRSSPLAAASLLACLAAAAGLPATLGGYAKFRLCAEAWSSGLGGGWVLLVLANTLLALACLIRVARELLAPRAVSDPVPPAPSSARAPSLLAGALALATLALGLWPRALERWAQAALDFLRG